MADTALPSRNILHSAVGPFLWALLFLAIFLGVYFLQKPSELVINNSTIKEIFQTYGMYTGPALALLGVILLYILVGVKRVLGLRRFRVLDPLVILLVSLPALVFGYQLAYREKPYTDIARAIIGTLAMPLLIASLAVSVLALVWFLLCLLRRR